MKKSIRFALMSVLLLAAYVLSACAGATSQTTGVSKGAKVRAEVVFTGAVEAIGGNQWTIKGQVVTVDAKTALDPNIKLGDTVKVEGHLGQDGALVAAKIESSVSDDPDVFSTPSPDVNGTPDASSTSDPAASSTPDLSATGTPRALDDDKNEFFGTIEAIAADSVTIDGQTYQLSGLTEIKDVLAVGNLVKVHFSLNADRTLTVHEIEKSAGLDGDDHSGSGGLDDGPRHDANDDHGIDGRSHDSQDDHHGGDGSGHNGNGGHGDDNSGSGSG